MPTASEPLMTLLDGLEVWLRANAARPREPEWTRILIADDADVTRVGDRKPSLDRAALQTPRAFEPRWRQLVNRGLRDWINLSAVGVSEDALVVLAEAPSYGEPGSHTPDRISVNFSGPELSSGWRVDAVMTIA